MIEVKRTTSGDPMEFEVTVSEKGSETRHRVTLSASTYEKLARGKPTPEQFIQAAFEFLLDREPKESILPRFDISVISRYFPIFEADR